MTPEQLHAWRGRLKLTQAQAANELGASLTAFRGWQGGKHPVPHYIALAAWAVSLRLLLKQAEEIEDRRDAEAKPAKVQEKPHNHKS
jgi:transcriptional regulator with XRE-family HTH domain